MSTSIKLSEPLRENKTTGYIFIPLLLVISFFGFYIPNFGLRTSHLILYSLFLVALLIHATRRPSLIKISPFIPLVFLWGLLLLWYYLSSVVSESGFDYVKILAMADNIVAPVAIILIMTAFLRKATAQIISNILIQVCNLLSILLAINSLLILVNFFWDISFFFAFFQPASDPIRGTTVWERSLTMGRYIGLFVAPFEAGVTYTLGIIVWLYVRRKQISSSFFQQACLGLMIIGSALSVSKTSIFAVPLIIGYAILNFRHIKNIFNWRLAVIILLIAQLYIRGKDFWSGSNLFMRYFSLEYFSLSLVSGNRYGSDSFGVMQKFKAVWSQSPLFGFGIGHGFGAVNPTVADSAYLEVFWIGGLVALIIYFLIFCFLFRPGLVNFKISEEAKFLTMLNIYVALAGLGAPVLTLNNISIIFWILTSLLFIIINFQRRVPHQVYAASESGNR